MPKLDRWTMRARVGRMERERPDLEHSIVKGLYQDYFEAREREPTFDEFHEHVDEVTSTVEWRDLHDWYSPHEPTEEEKAALLDGVGPRSVAHSTPTRRGRGRPKGTRSVSRDQIIETYRSLRRAYGRHPTQAELAMNLEPRIAKRTLQGHLVHYGLPWPPG